MDSLTKIRYELLISLFGDLDPDEIRELTRYARAIKSRQISGDESNQPVLATQQAPTH